MMGDFRDARAGRGGPGTPHQPPRNYVLFDNLYCNGEVSMDGHSRCDPAITTASRQRRWILQHTAHGQLPANKQMDTPVNGALWDLCKRNGVSFKCYGEG